MGHTKKVGSAGRFGARLGIKLKKKLSDLEKQQRAKHICSYCKKQGGVKRVAMGIWYCTKCNTKFAGRAYVPA